MEIKLLTDCTHCIPELTRLHFEQWRDISPQITLATTEKKIKKHLNSKNIPLTFVAFDHNDILGSASLRIDDHDTKKDISPWLGGMLVKPSARGKGICRILENEVCQKAVSLNFNKIYLFTFDKEALYFHLGWSHLDKGTFMGKNVSFMYKDLTI